MTKQQMARNDTTKMTYQVTEEKFDWDATPLTPIGRRGMVFIHPDNRNTFAPHCDIGYVVGRALHHYRLLEFYIPDTRGYRLSGTYRLYPQRCRMPTISEEDRTLEVIADLLKQMKVELPPSVKGKKQWLQIIKKLRTTLSNGEPSVATQGPLRMVTQGQTRVDGKVTTSTSPTCPRILRTKPRIHQQTTRRKSPR